MTNLLDNGDLENAFLTPPQQSLELSSGPRAPRKSWAKVYMLIALVVALVVAAFMISAWVGPTSAESSEEFLITREDYTDVATGVVHPAVFRCGNEMHELAVLGAGPSSDSEDQLSIAMYIEPARARSDLEEFQGRSAAELRVGGSALHKNVVRKFAVPYYTAISRGMMDRAIRMQVTSPALTRSQLLSNIKVALPPRLASLGVSDTNALVDKFNDMVMLDSDENFQTGDVLTFSVTDGSFEFSYNDKKSDISIDNDGNFNEAFWNIFTDSDSTAPDAKERFADRVPLLWTTGALNLHVTESENVRSGTEFPETVSVHFDNTAANLALTGTSSQTAFSLSGQDLTVSLYADEKLLANFEDGVTLSEQVISGADGTRALRFDVKNDILASAFSSDLFDGMLPTLDAHFSTLQRIDQENQALRDLMPFRFYAGDTFYVACNQNSQLGISMNGNSVVAPEPSPELCEAIFSSYLGTDALVDSSADLVSWAKQMTPTLPPTPEPTPDAADVVDQEGNSFATYAGMLGVVGLSVLGVASASRINTTKPVTLTQDDDLSPAEDSKHGYVGVSAGFGASPWGTSSGYSGVAVAAASRSAVPTMSASYRGPWGSRSTTGRTRSAGRMQTRMFAVPPAYAADIPPPSNYQEPAAIVRQAPERPKLESYQQQSAISNPVFPSDQKSEKPVADTPYVRRAPLKVSYGRFVENLDRYERVSFVSDGSTATATDVEGNSYYTSPLINAADIVKMATERNIDVVITAPGQNMSVVPFFLNALGSILPPVFLFWLFFGRGGGGQGGGGGMGGPNPFNAGKSNAKFQMDPETGVTFADVAGCDESKAELVEVVDFLKNPERYAKLGAKIPRGVVLEGPPGTGKTLLAKAVAGEAGVPFVATSGSEFVEMFVGVGASRVRDLFAEAKKNAPCIVFIDEIDAVGRSRGGNGGGMAGGNQEQESTLNQILTEMDGFDSSVGVIVLAATNRADVLDAALLRPGRFDRRVTVGNPDLLGRIEILKVHARGKPLADDVDLKSLAKRTMGFSGASLQNLMNEGAIYAARRKSETISNADIDSALDRIIVGLEKKGVVQTENTRRTVAYHEAGHALLGALVPDYDLVQKITIIPRSNGAGGLTFFSPSEERLGSGLYTREYLECQLAVALGGRLAEELAFGDAKVTTGASSDIQNVARIARSMVTEWGMSRKVGPIAMMTNGGMMSQGPAYAADTLLNVDNEVLRLVNNAYALGRKLMEENREVLDDIAEALMEHEQIDGVEFQKILNKYGIVPRAYSDLSLEDLEAAGYLPKEIVDVAKEAISNSNGETPALSAEQYKNALKNSDVGGSNAI